MAESAAPPPNTSSLASDDLPTWRSAAVCHSVSSGSAGRRAPALCGGNFSARFRLPRFFDPELKQPARVRGNVETWQEARNDVRRELA